MERKKKKIENTKQKTKKKQIENTKQKTKKKQIENTKQKKKKLVYLGIEPGTTAW